MIPFPNKKYSVIYADPPWSYQDKRCIFKWSETDIPLKKILQIIGRQPLYGHKSGKRMQTHWLCFMKESFYEE